MNKKERQAYLQAAMYNIDWVLDGTDDSEDCPTQLYATVNEVKLNLYITRSGCKCYRGFTVRAHIPLSVEELAARDKYQSYTTKSIDLVVVEALAFSGFRRMNRWYKHTLKRLLKERIERRQLRDFKLLVTVAGLQRKHGSDERA